MPTRCVRNQCFLLNWSLSLQRWIQWKRQSHLQPFAIKSYSLRAHCFTRLLLESCVGIQCNGNSACHVSGSTGIAACACNNASLSYDSVLGCVGLLFYIVLREFVAYIILRCVAPTATPTTATTSSSSSSSATTIIVICVVVPIVLVLLVVVARTLVFDKKRKYKRGIMQQQLQELQVLHDAALSQLLSNRTGLLAVNLKGIPTRMFVIFIDIDFAIAESELQSLEIDRSTLHMRYVIGRGRFGQVQLAEYTPATSSRTQTVAVKMLLDQQPDHDKIGTTGNDADAGGFEEQARLFFMEARLLNAMRHAHIVELVAVVLRRFPCMIVMEYMENGDLRSYLRLCQPSRANRKRDIDEGDLQNMSAQVASAMAFLESKRIVHRDLAARFENAQMANVI